MEYLRFSHSSRMSSAQGIKTSEEVRSRKWSSYFTFFLVKEKKENRMENYIIDIVHQSEICKYSPLLKKLIIHNIRVCFIVIETSSSQSLKIICTSTPYLLTLISKRNPKLKKVLENENFIDCLRKLRECDLKPIFANIRDATLVIQEGVRKCYPSFVVHLARNSDLFGELTVESLLRAVVNLLISAFRFIYEDLSPMLQVFCAENYSAVNSFLKNAPPFLMIVAKEFRTLIVFAKNNFLIFLKCVNWMVTFLHHVFSDTCVGSKVFNLFKKCLRFLKYVVKYILYHVFCQRNVRACTQLIGKVIPYAQGILFEYSERCWTFIQESAPDVCRQVRNAFLTGVSFLIKLIKNNKQTLIDLLRIACQDFKICIRHLAPVCNSMSWWTISSIVCAQDIGQFVLPHAIKFCSYVFNHFFDLCRYVMYSLRHVFGCLQKVYPVFADALVALPCTLYETTAVVARMSLRPSRCIVVISHRIISDVIEMVVEIAPVFWYVTLEMNSIIFDACSAVATQTFHGIRCVTPSIYCALRTVTPATLQATNEVVRSSKNSVVLVYPIVVQALLVAHPVVRKGLLVVLTDGNKAFMEVTAASCIASRELQLAASKIAKEMPILLQALDEISSTTFTALVVVHRTSSNARSKVTCDFKRALYVTGTSILYAHLEIITTFTDVFMEVRSVILDSDEIHDLVTLVAGTRNVLLQSVCRGVIHSLLFLSRKLKNVKNMILLLQKWPALWKGLLNSVIVAIISRVITKHLDFVKCQKHAKLILIYLLNFIKGIIMRSYCKILTLFRRDSSDKFNSCMSVLYERILNCTCSATVLLYEFSCDMISNVMQNICQVTRILWQIVKDVISCMWLNFITLVPKVWIVLEISSSRLWSITCLCVPETWFMFKTLCNKGWLFSCDMIPVMWELLIPYAPILWSDSCCVIQFIWNLFLQVCSCTWSCSQCVSSEIWTQSCSTLPGLWITFCDQSENNWNRFCDVMEFNWNVITTACSLSWYAFQKSSSTSWKFVVRPLAASVSCRTCLALTKSLKISYTTCTSTRSALCLMLDEFLKIRLLVTRYSLVNRSVESDDSLEGSTLKGQSLNVEKLLSFNKVALLSTLPFHLTKRYFCYIKSKKIVNDLKSVSKSVPFSASVSWAYSENLRKRLCATFSAVSTSVSYINYANFYPII